MDIYQKEIERQIESHLETLRFIEQQKVESINQWQELERYVRNRIAELVDQATQRPVEKEELL